MEKVMGLSRITETMYIQRDEKGNIEKVFDYQHQEIDKTMLFKSFMSVVVENGFTYKGEFIEMPNIKEMMKKRTLGYQRRKRTHDFSSYL